MRLYFGTVSVVPVMGTRSLCPEFGSSEWQLKELFSILPKTSICSVLHNWIYWIRRISIIVETVYDCWSVHRWPSSSLSLFVCCVLFLLLFLVCLWYMRKTTFYDWARSIIIKGRVFPLKRRGVKVSQQSVGSPSRKCGGGHTWQARAYDGDQGVELPAGWQGRAHTRTLDFTMERFTSGESINFPKGGRARGLGDGNSPSEVQSPRSWAKCEISVQFLTFSRKNRI